MAGKGMGWMEDMAEGLLPYKCHPRHLPAPAADHRRTHAHEPHLPTPAHDVARRILGEDVTQIENYTERVKWVVGKVHLQRHHPLRARHLRHGGRRIPGLTRSIGAAPR